MAVNEREVAFKKTDRSTAARGSVPKPQGRAKAATLQYGKRPKLSSHRRAHRRAHPSSIPGAELRHWHERRFPHHSRDQTRNLNDELLELLKQHSDGALYFKTIFRQECTEWPVYCQRPAFGKLADLAPHFSWTLEGSELTVTPASGPLRVGPRGAGGRRMHRRKECHLARCYNGRLTRQRA